MEAVSQRNGRQAHLLERPLLRRLVRHGRAQVGAHHLKQFRDCSSGGGSCRPLPCTGWTYTIDKANLRTAVSIPVRCFPNASAKVKVLPFHVIVSFDSARVVDPLTATPWIRRG